ncbi:MAG: hypothetical protein U1F43_29655 [Myxococcota bacterium]
MLAAYLVTLIVGGVFVGLSALAGLGKDLDGGSDHDLGHDFAGHAGGVAAAHEPSQAAEHDAQGHIGSSGEDVVEAVHSGPVRRPWMPFTSFRFWTFGAFLFGLTGLALTELAGAEEPGAMLAALALGVGGGTAASALVHVLRKPIGEAPDRRDWVGAVGELQHALSAGAASKIRAVLRGRDRDLVVTLADASARPLPKGTRVVVLAIGEDGRALVAPETAMFGRRRVATERDARDEAAVDEAAVDETARGETAAREPRTRDDEEEVGS